MAHKTSRNNKQIMEAIEAVLERARPALATHSGGIQCVGIDDEGMVSVSMSGHCAHCALSTVTLGLGIEKLLKAELPDIVTGVKEV